jgi:hypothetical protein
MGKYIVYREGFYLETWIIGVLEITYRLRICLCTTRNWTQFTPLAEAFNKGYYNTTS